jgi:hypothetical protein
VEQYSVIFKIMIQNEKKSKAVAKHESKRKGENKRYRNKYDGYVSKDVINRVAEQMKVPAFLSYDLRELRPPYFVRSVSRALVLCSRIFIIN